MKEERANFGSKLGMILATAGSAVGLGNIWRFPYMTGQNGGAVFILIYIICVLMLGVPCMVNEFIIGRHGTSNAARAYAHASGGTSWRYVGYMGVLTGFLITGYYAVVAGWCLQYIFASLMGNFQGDTNYVSQYFADFSTSTFRPILWTIVILVITHFIIIRGVRGGIERASKFLMPTLFILLLVVVVAACMLPGAWKGIDFLFRPDFSKLDSSVLLGALGQAFFSLSVGMGCLCTYASYFSRRTNLVKTASQICVIDTIVAILAGLMIFPAAFSIGVNPDSGPSLIFVTLPNVFGRAFGAVSFVGVVVAVMFYALLCLAALTSLISLHEVSTAFFCEEFHTSRKRAASVVTATCCVIGAFCSLSLGSWDWLKIGGKSLFDVFDFLTGQILLPFGGFLTCLFLGWRMPKKIVHDEFTNCGALRGTLYGVYLFCVRFVCPVCIMLVFLNQLGIV